MSTKRPWTIPVSTPVRSPIRRRGPMPVIMAKSYGKPIYGWRYEVSDEPRAKEATTKNER